MNSRVRSALLAAVPALLCSAQVGAQAPTADLPDADPAIWVVKDPDTTIYLFGTFHALDGKTDWFNEEVRQAFDEAAELVIETRTPENPAELQPVIAKYAIDKSGKLLSAKLSSAAREKLAKKLAEMGAPANAFDPMKPFFAAIALSAAEMQKLGLSPAHGSEAVLTKAAKQAGKTIDTLETAEFQIALFDKLPEPMQIEMLESTLDQLPQFKELFAQMAGAWNKGDAESMAELLQEMNAQSPEAFKLIFTDRNATWAEWINQRLDKPGTVFLAVGAGHLAGKDSVQDMLRARDIGSERVRDKVANSIE